MWVMRLQFIYLKRNKTLKKIYFYNKLGVRCNLTPSFHMDTTPL